MFSTETWDPWGGSSRRGFTTLLSFVLQAAGVGLLLLVPLVYTGAMPQFDLVRRVFLPLPPAGSQASSIAHQSAGGKSNFAQGVLVVPRSIPLHAARIDDRGMQPLNDTGIFIPYGTGTSMARNGVINSIGEMTQPFVPKPPAAVAHPPRISAMMEGYLVHKVEPVYPPLARSARVQGTVELQAIISKQGTIEKVQVLRGHPMLVKAALDAVQQWRYRPYILNGEPVEVETHVTVNFSLAGG
jgi:periplasmic protein TonB